MLLVSHLRHADFSQNHIKSARNQKKKA